jgi:hypothetical protein
VTSQLHRPRCRTGLHHSSARPACTKHDRHHAFCLRQALGKHPTPKARLWYVACLFGLGAASSTFLRRHVITTVGHSRPRLHTTVPAPVWVRSHSTITTHAQRWPGHCIVATVQHPVARPCSSLDPLPSAARLAHPDTVIAQATTRRLSWALYPCSSCCGVYARQWTSPTLPPPEQSYASLLVQELAGACS